MIAEMPKTDKEQRKEKRKKMMERRERKEAKKMRLNGIGWIIERNRYRSCCGWQ